MTALNGSQSVDRALALLAMVGRHADRGAALSMLVDESGLNKPTARRLLLALMRAGMVEQEDTSRRYYLGQQAYVVGALAGRRFGLLQMAMDSLIRLSRATEDSTFLSVRRDNASVCLYREEGTYPVRTHALQAGFEHPLGVGAGSLAMLAALDDDEIDQVIAANAELLAQNYPMLPPSRILADVAMTRRRGYALNPGLIYANSWGVGVAVCLPDGKPAGALSIAAIDGRMQEARQIELAALLRHEAVRVEVKLARLFDVPAETKSIRTRQRKNGRLQR